MDRRAVAREANDAVGSEIRAARARHGWSRSELAAKADVPEVSLERYESGKREIPLPAMLALASALEITPEKLFEDAREHNVGVFTHLDEGDGEGLG